jgi:hypothetical protein
MIAKMDGNYDGIPGAKQWRGYPSATRWAEKVTAWGLKVSRLLPIIKIILVFFER